MYMSRLEDEEVNNIGSVIICCEAKPSPPVPLTKHSIKALIWSKKVTVTLPTSMPFPRTQTLVPRVVQRHRAKSGSPSD